MFNWHSIWEAKATEPTSDLTLLSGHERVDLDLSQLYAQLESTLCLNAKASVLEVGCAAGLLRSGLECDYVGIDYAFGMCRKFKTMFNEPVLQAHAASLPFSSNSFDACFSFSVFHYFEDIEYAMKAVSEMCRVARYSVFIGDLPVESHDPNHLTFDSHNFPGWQITPGISRSTRFNILKVFSGFRPPPGESNHANPA